MNEYLYCHVSRAYNEVMSTTFHSVQKKITKALNPYEKEMEEKMNINTFYDVHL